MMLNIEKTERMDWVLIEHKITENMHWVTKEQWDDIRDCKNLYNVMCRINNGIGVRMTMGDPRGMRTEWQIFHQDAEADVVVAKHEKWLKEKGITE